MHPVRLDNQTEANEMSDSSTRSDGSYDCNHCPETYSGMFAKRRLKEHNRRKHGVQAL